MKNTMWTYTRPVAGYFPKKDKYVLYLERRNRFYDWLTRVFNRPFVRSGYGDNVWGDLWDWSYHKSQDNSEIVASFVITKEEAEQISPGISAKLDLTWLDTQSSDEH